MSHQLRAALAVIGLLLGIGGCAREPPEAAYRRAEAHLYRAEYKAARSIAERQLRYWGNPNGRVWNWKFRNLLAETLLSMGKPAEAAAQVQGHADTPELEARRSINLALALYKLHRDAEANQLLDRAESLVSDPELLGRAGTARGNWYLDQGNLTEAETSYLRIRELYEHQSPYRKIRYWINVGHLRLLQYRFQDAIASFENALAAARQIGDRRAEQIALGDLATCSYWTGDYARAEQLYIQAETVAAQVADKDSQVKWLVVRGELAAIQHNFQGAVALYEAAQKLISAEDYEWQINLDNDLTESSIELKNLAAAGRYYQKALRLCTRSKLRRLLPRTQLDGARLAAARGDNDAAIGLLLGIVKADAASIDPKDLWESHYRLASLYAARMNAAEADLHYRTALEIIGEVLPNVSDDGMKYTFLDSSIRFYQEYVQFLMNQKQRERALEVTESAHARVLRDKIGAGRLPAARDLVTHLTRMVRGANTVLLSYWVDESRSYLWAVSRNG